MEQFWHDPVWLTQRTGNHLAFRLAVTLFKPFFFWLKKPEQEKLWHKLTYKLLYQPLAHTLGPASCSQVCKNYFKREISLKE